MRPGARCTQARLDLEMHGYIRTYMYPVVSVCPVRFYAGVLLCFLHDGFNLEGRCDQFISPDPRHDRGTLNRPASLFLDRLHKVSLLSLLVLTGSGPYYSMARATQGTILIT